MTMRKGEYVLLSGGRQTGRTDYTLARARAWCEANPSKLCAVIGIAGRLEMKFVEEKMIKGTCHFAPNTLHEQCDSPTWRPIIQTCTRQEPHICKVNGPCNGWPTNGAFDPEDTYVAYCRYTEKGTIVTCNSDEPKAFKVYRHPANKPQTVSFCPAE